MLQCLQTCLDRLIFINDSSEKYVRVSDLFRQTVMRQKRQNMLASELSASWNTGCGLFPTKLCIVLDKYISYNMMQPEASPEYSPLPRTLLKIILMYAL